MILILHIEIYQAILLHSSHKNISTLLVALESSDGKNSSLEISPFPIKLEFNNKKEFFFAFLQQERILR